jgi:hypothetical protein
MHQKHHMFNQPAGFYTVTSLWARVMIKHQSFSESPVLTKLAHSQ